MDLIYGVSQVLHRIKLKLYPNYLPGREGTFYARTSSEATLSVEQICASKRDRGGFSGNFGDFVNYVKQFIEEIAYQLCDGFAVNLGFFTIYPNLGGSFRNKDENPDPKTHPLTMRIRPHGPMRRLVETIAIVIEGEADPSGHITEFLDHENNSINGVFEPGNQFVLTGEKIRIAGDNPSCGLYFVPVGGAPIGGHPAPIKMTRIVENTSNKIIGIIPETDWAFIKVEIRTQYAGSGSVFLKEPRVITSDFTIEHV
jgi:hypothetical protein